MLQHKRQQASAATCTQQPPQSVASLAPHPHRVTPLPSALIALSPLPGATTQSCGNPSSAAASAVSVPTTWHGG